MRLTAAFPLIALAFIGPTRAHAWTDAPLCVAQQPVVSEYQSIYREPDRTASLLCEPEESRSYTLHEPYTLQQGPLWTAPIGPDVARRALREATQLATSSPADALLKLRLVERAMPRIADRLSMQRAEILRSLNRMNEACEAYGVAVDSPDRNVASEARIGLVRCLLQAGNKRGEVELDRLYQRYPSLGERASLQVELAHAKEGWNDLAGAVVTYRAVALKSPETQAASDAQSALERLREAGVKVNPFTPEELLERADKLVYRGTVEAGRTAVADLLARSDLPTLIRGRAHLLAARVARMEGRWNGVREEVEKSIGCGIPKRDAQRYLPRALAAVEEAQNGHAEQRIKKLLAGRPLARLNINQQRAVLDEAVVNGLTDYASEALEAMASNSKMPAPSLYSAAIAASGTASPQALLRAFNVLRSVRSLKLQATYYYGRALEASGQLQEAQTAYYDVMQLDSAGDHYYSTWAQARLTALSESNTNNCVQGVHGECVPHGNVATAAADADAQPAPTVPTTASAGLATVFSLGDLTSRPTSGLPGRDVLRRETLVARLNALAAVHGNAFPWLARAADLVELERYEDAASEISQVYIAYHDARGRMRMRVGAEAVLMNATQPRFSMPGNVRSERLRLDEWARLSLAEVADMLDEPGVAIRLREQRGEPRPRAYAREVERAAKKYGVDPNLLFAVMRVESVYYREIVSFAGAVGLMQIMPHTGMRIARALGNTDFNPRELLDPSTNIEFAGWYLASLISRFDGRIPLAIAAYNGGPHNVRLWLKAHPKDMPLDAFLERIPFRETNRYVRRVLSHYAAYRAQQNLAMLNLADTLPRQRPDTIAF
ncbi:MAG TPA: transglycosylase SLT domain-containing protein [Polyangiales bacterium]|nr:transglycosylase SLT domain-containing protein [Polyangiales bacterium]